MKAVCALRVARQRWGEMDGDKGVEDQGEKFGELAGREKGGIFEN